MPLTFFKPKVENFNLFTLTKSGSHLLMKYLDELTSFEMLDHPMQKYGRCGSKNIKYSPQKKAYEFWHFNLHPRVEQVLLINKKGAKKNIFLVRNLKDVLLSLAFQIQKFPNTTFTHHEVGYIDLNLNLKEMIKWLLITDQAQIPLSIINQAKMIHRYHNHPNTLILKYEDLVGSKGGSTDDRLQQSLNKLSDFLGVEEVSIDELTRNCYGKGKTFRAGKIESHKDHFNQELSQIFDQKLGFYQRMLGYT